MVETIFPQSPNWYLTKIISTREDGSVAYGSQTSIFILKHENNKVYPIILKGAHSGKITSVVFSPLKHNKKFQNSILSCSEDGFVKLWNMETLTPLIGHKSHGEPKELTSVKVVCADWSRCNPQYIVSAGENCTIVLWDAVGNMTTRFYFQKLKPSIIECSNHDERIVACGSMSGLVYIVKLVKKGEIICKLRGHDKEVQSLSWCPISEDSNISEQFLLASSCQEKEIYIWRTVDGSCEAKIPLPKNALSKSNNQGKWENSPNFIPLFWAEPYNLYAGTKYGELICCNLKDLLLLESKNGCMSEKQFNRKTSNCWKLIHSLHSNIVMAIAGLPTGSMTNSEDQSDSLYKSAENKMLEGNNENMAQNDNTVDYQESHSMNGEDLIWTIGKDYKLIAVHGNSETNNPKYNFHTLNGHSYDVAVSPHDPNKIALAGGDGKVRLWSAARPSGCTRIYWQKINDRVYAIAWHPTREGLLAFATSEGRVGLMEMYTLKQPTIFKAHHRGVVYRLSWGHPYSENGESSPLEKMEYSLYSVGNNNIFLHDPAKINSDALNLSRITNIPYKKFTDLSWKPDYTLLAVGCANGSVYLLRPPKLIVSQVILGSKKYIQSLVWHPLTTTIDTDCSSFHGYLTFGSTDNESVIKVYNCIVNDTCTLDQIAALKGHSGYVQSVSWSPHTAGRLISASADFSVRIWDVTKNTQILKFVISQAISPVFCIWSPIDPDVLIAGIFGRLALSWRISTDINKGSLIKDVKLKKGKSIEMGELLNDSETFTEGKSQEDTESGDLYNFPLASQVQKTVKESKMFVKILTSDKDPFEHCYDLLKGSDEGRDNLTNLFPLLGTENQFLEFLNTLGESLEKSNKWNEYYEMSLWRGNLNEVIKEKIETGHLDDFLVSLAPFASPRLWREACISYAKSLAEKKSYRKAACYLIAVHEVSQAIELLLKADLYLEAITVARCRLPESDPVYFDAIRKYADWLAKTGSFLKACECYIFLNEYVEAATILGKKNNVDYLSLAALASKKANLESLEREYAFSALLMCLESHNWDLASRICGDHQNLKHLSVLHTIHHEMIRIDAGVVILEKDLIDHLCELIGIKGESNIYGALEYAYENNLMYLDKKKLHVTWARELALACCAVDKDTKLKHIIRVLNATSRWTKRSTEDPTILYKFCTWLCTKDYLIGGSIFCWDDGNNTPKITSLRAYLCQGLVEYLDYAYSQNNDGCFDRLLDMELILAELVNNALDEMSYVHIQNQLGIIICEKAINEAYQKKNGLIAVERCDSGLEKSGNGTDIATCESVEKPKHGEESERCDDLNSLIISEKEKMRRLKAEVEHFEKSRIVAPDPHYLYSMLKKVSDASPNPRGNLKRLIEDKWEQLK